MLYHGTRKPSAVAHIGLCLTESETVAQTYAGRSGTIYQAIIALSELEVVEVESYDRDSNVAPGDDGEYPDADVIVYEDEDERGWQHTTYRLASARAVAACTLIEVESTPGIEGAPEGR